MERRNGTIANGHYEPYGSRPLQAEHSRFDPFDTLAEHFRTKVLPQALESRDATLEWLKLEAKCAAENFAPALQSGRNLLVFGAILFVVLLGAIIFAACILALAVMSSIPPGSEWQAAGIVGASLVVLASAAYALFSFMQSRFKRSMSAACAPLNTSSGL